MYVYSISNEAKKLHLYCTIVCPNGKAWKDLTQRELAFVYEKHPAFVRKGYLTRLEKPKPVRATKASKDDK
jgi:hypothetical protein